MKHWSVLAGVCSAFVFTFGVYAADQTTPKPPEATQESGESEVDVAVADLPKAVATAANTAQTGGTISGAEKETKNGVDVYELKVTNNGKKYEVKIDPTGKVLSNKIDDDDAEQGEKDVEDKQESGENEADVALADLPKAVADAAKSAQSGGVVAGVEKKTKNGVVSYELKVTNNGKKYEVEIDPTGKVLSNKIDDDDNEHEGKDMEDKD